MRIRLADYVASFLAEHGVKDIFSVVGGGAMHLNDAFGHRDDLHVTYNHHEQACAIAAESYARLENRIAAVCVTTGPGGTNALTGVVGGWLDSIPMFIVSGQVRYDTTARYAYDVTGARLRAMGDQEYDIVKSVLPMTKYAVMIEKPENIRYSLEKAWHLAVTGRLGPVWVDIPVNFQGTYIETESLKGYDPSEDAGMIPESVGMDEIDYVLEKIKRAKRPVLYAGNGIRLSGGYNEFRKTVESLNIPVVTYWNAIDLIETEHPLYCGRAGNMGDRPGNWAIQNADVILAVGTRISIRQVGYNWKTWAREAEVIMVDIDPEEFKKPTLHVEHAIWADARDFFEKMNIRLEGMTDGEEAATMREKAFNANMVTSLTKEDTEPKEKRETAISAKESENCKTGDHSSWNKTCEKWKKEYPVVGPEKYDKDRKYSNVYAFIDSLSRRLKDGSLTAVSNGACCVAGHQAYVIKKNTRFIINSAIASMGYGLPAAIGLCIAGGRQSTVCLEGDGSIMMNLQELQTVVTNRLPIKIFLINNKGYHSIRITQNNLFAEHKKVGIGEESGDLGFPSFEKIADAFGIKYFCIKNNEDFNIIDEVLKEEEPAFCEVFTDTEQVWEPKSSTKRLEDGTLVSPPLEDLAPFLPREELKEKMFIPMIDE